MVANVENVVIIMLYLDQDQTKMVVSMEPA